MTRPLSHIKTGLAVVLGLMFVSLPAWSDDAALIAAAKSGDTATIRTLLAQGADPDTRDETGISALEWAAAKGHLTTVKALLDDHAAVDGASIPDKFTPLMRAANFGHKDVAALLIARGADVNARAASGYTALDYAVNTDKRDVVALLKKHGAKRGAGAAGLTHPQTLCDAGKNIGFYAQNWSWTAYAKYPTQYYCQGIQHDSPGGEGNMLMFTYQVDGTAGKAQGILITTDIYADSLPKDAINRNVQPLLTSIYAVAGKGPMPGDLTDAVAALSVVQEDTALGSVTTAYRPGDHADMPYNGAEYTIQIILH